MQILHISADFPDPLIPAKTRAISSLLALVPEHDHRVWSLNRVRFHHPLAALEFGPGHRALAYGAPPMGVALAGRLDRVAEFILDDLERRNEIPDIIHAHKLSVEGLVGARVARHLQRPLIVSSQGDSDLKIIGARLGLRRRWRNIWTSAAVALPFAPWTWTRLDALLGRRTKPTYVLPCPLTNDEMYSPTPASDPVVRSAFHLASYGRKNAAGLMRAVARAAVKLPDLRLEIVGGGDAEAFATLSRLARSIDATRIHFLGPRPPSEMGGLFNSAICMALVSHRESFGMVFAEALLAGCPVLGPAGWAIDGFLPEGEAGLFVPAKDELALSEALIRLVLEEADFKRRLTILQENGRLDCFRQSYIQEIYRRALTECSTVDACS